MKQFLRALLARRLPLSPLASLTFPGDYTIKTWRLCFPRFLLSVILKHKEVSISVVWKASQTGSARSMPGVGCGCGTCISNKFPDAQAPVPKQLLDRLDQSSQVLRAQWGFELRWSCARPRVPSSSVPSHLPLCHLESPAIFCSSWKGMSPDAVPRVQLGYLH